jgi:hypothetical protein
MTLLSAWYTCQQPPQVTTPHHTTPHHSTPLHTSNGRCGLATSDLGPGKEPETTASAEGTREGGREGGREGEGKNSGFGETSFPQGGGEPRKRRLPALIGIVRIDLFRFISRSLLSASSLTHSLLPHSLSHARSLFRALSPPSRSLSRALPPLRLAPPPHTCWTG